MATYKSNTIDGYYLSLELTESSVSQSGNSSIVKYVFKLNCGNKYFQDYAITRSCTINGTTVHSSSGKLNMTGYNTSLTLASGTMTIGHNTDGSKSVSCSFSATGAGGWTWSGTLSGSGTFTLTKINRTPPTINSFTVTETNTKVSAKNSSVTIQGLSSKTLTVSVTANDGSTISSVTVTNSNKSVTLSLSSGKYTGTMTGMTSGTYTLTVKDSNGLSSTSTVTQTYYSYSAPAVTSSSFTRTTATGDAGNLSFAGTYTNILSNSVTYKVSGAWTGSGSAGSSGSWSVSHAFSSGLTYNQSFTASITVTDSFGQTGTASVTLSASQYALWIGKTGIRTGDGGMIGSVFYQSGDSYTINNSGFPTALGAFVTSSATEFCFSMSLPKSMANVTPSVTALKANLRGTSGYIYNSNYSNSFVTGGHDYVADSLVTVSVRKANDYILEITLTNSSAWSGVTNNTPAAIGINTLTISFK